MIAGVPAHNAMMLSMLWQNLGEIYHRMGDEAAAADAFGHSAAAAVSM